MREAKYCWRSLRRFIVVCSLLWRAAFQYCEPNRSVHLFCSSFWYSLTRIDWVWQPLSRSAYPRGKGRKYTVCAKYCNDPHCTGKMLQKTAHNYWGQSRWLDMRWSRDTQLPYATAKKNCVCSRRIIEHGKRAPLPARFCWQILRRDAFIFRARNRITFLRRQKNLFWSMLI